MRTEAGFPNHRETTGGTPTQPPPSPPPRPAPDRVDAPRPAARHAPAGLNAIHQENFIVLSLLVPKALQDDYMSIYMFCRVADDIADERLPGESAAAGNARALAELRLFRKGLDWALASGDQRDAPPALSESRRLILQLVADTIAQRGLSREPFDWLLDAFEQDQVTTRYQTWSQLLAYCARSANPVGRLVLALHGYGDASMGPGRDEESRLRLAASDAICTGLQLANFWQDVRRDLLERDRVYIPSEDAGVHAEDLRAWLEAAPDAHARQRYAAALRGLVDRSWTCFAAGKPLSALVDRRTAWTIWLFRRAGEVVLRRIEQQNYTTLWHRVTVPKSKRATLLLQAIGGYILHRTPRSS